MGVFDKMKEPVFLKEDSSLPGQLEVLEELAKSVPPEAAKKLEQEIRNVRAGIIGEQQITFELKNSHIPMYVLHDIYLEHEGLAAQIDFLVLTRRRNFVIECKNLYGNVEITEQGDFIRNIGFNGKFFRERIYSPITQNERHLALIRQIRAQQRTNMLTQALFQKYFSTNYRSVVVLANNKAVLNNRCPIKEVQEQVVPADRLVAHIKRVNAERGAEDSFEKDWTELAHFFLEQSRPAPDYMQKYREMFGFHKTEEKPAEKPPENEEQILCPKCGAPMVLRTATKGDRAGSNFYGCSRFPKCRGIINTK